MTIVSFRYRFQDLSSLHHCFVLWFLFLSGFSQGMSAGVGGLDAVMSGEERLVQEMWALGRDLLQC